MLGPRRNDNATVYLIADHLDAALAAGEDMLKQRLDLAEASGTRHPPVPGERLRQFVETVRTLEMILVAHTLQARNRARELAAANAPLKRLLRLFAGGTAALQDAVEELGDATEADFDTADDPLVYLRSRGLLAADAGSLLCIEQISVGEHFLIAHRIALGTLMDLTAAFLDALEDCYDLAVEDELAADTRSAHTISAHHPGLT